MLRVNAIDLYYGAAQALRAVSLAAEPGKVTCVLGRNGVGKTSLLDALAGQHPVSSGTITLDGSDITRLSPSERARQGIAYVPQGREIFPLLTVEENLKTGFAPLKREDRSIPDDVFSLFPVLGDMLGRRGGAREETVYRVADLELDRLSHRVTRGKEEIMLQPREFRLLEYLMRHAGQVVTRTMLLENVWDYHFDPQTNVIDVHISRLRSKIDKGRATPLLHTVRGAGYMIRESAR